MITYIISLLFILGASICNSIMDILSHKYHSSIFNSKKYDPQWWDASLSWRNKYNNGNPMDGRRKLFGRVNYPVQLTDAWHFFKTLMIIFLCTSVTLVTLTDTFIFVMFGNNWDYVLSFIFHMLIMGTVWNVTFSRFYGNIWLKKK
jgi:hypothetical protein